MSERLPNGHVALGQYMSVLDVTRPQRKTAVFDVLDRHDGQLGQVRWYGAWRQYCFFPKGEPVFNPDCLRRIAAFVARATREHRSSASPTTEPK